MAVDVSRDDVVNLVIPLAVLAVLIAALAWLGFSAT